MLLDDVDWQLDVVTWCVCDRPARSEEDYSASTNPVSVLPKNERHRRSRPPSSKRHHRRHPGQAVRAGLRLPANLARNRFLVDAHACCPSAAAAPWVQGRTPVFTSLHLWSTRGGACSLSLRQLTNDRLTRARAARTGDNRYDPPCTNSLRPRRRRQR